MVVSAGKCTKFRTRRDRISDVYNGLIFHPADTAGAPSIKIKPEGEIINSEFEDVDVDVAPAESQIVAVRRKPSAPAEARDEGDHELLPLPFDAVPAADAIMPVADWSSWDLGKALRQLGGTNNSHIVRTLRQLHLRWWHAPAARMLALLTSAGLPQTVLSLVKSVCDTCRVCRLWHRPGDKAVATLRLSQEFNQAVQCDLLFWGQAVILHLIDECTRWSSAQVILSKKVCDMLPAIVSPWFRFFGPLQVMYSEHEGALRSEEASIMFERWACSIKPKPVGSHAYQVEA